MAPLESLTKARRTPHAAWGVAQLAATLALLIWAYRRVDLSQLASTRLAPAWLLLAVASVAPAYAAAALRWSFTARRMGVPLSYRHALREVYLAGFLNSVLPTGLAGDVLRVARHARAGSSAEPSYERAFLSALLERFAGQVLLWLFLLASLCQWPLARLWPYLPWLSFPLLLAGGLAFAYFRRRIRRASAGADGALLSDARRALLGADALCVHVVTSSVVLAACTLGFACSAKAVLVQLGFLDLLRIVPPLLLASALPLSIGGFGVRETLSGLLYAENGLAAQSGSVAASIYGLAYVAASAPVALYVLLAPQAASFKRMCSRFGSRVEPRASTLARAHRGAAQPEEHSGS
jgi:uncharacterized membrane protein YbhN (UPF0104 family)